MGKKKKKTSALTRQMLKSIVAELEADEDDPGQGARLGRLDAANMIKEAFALDPPASKHDAAIRAASSALALDDDTGRGIGWLEMIWDTAYREGQRQPSISLVQRIMRWYS